MIAYLMKAFKSNKDCSHIPIFFYCQPCIMKEMLIINSHIWHLVFKGRIVEAITMCLTFFPKAHISPDDIASFVWCFLTLNCSTTISSSWKKKRNHLPRSYFMFDLVWLQYNFTFLIRTHFHFSWLHTNYHRLGETWFKAFP